MMCSDSLREACSCSSQVQAMALYSFKHACVDLRFVFIPGSGLGDEDSTHRLTFVVIIFMKMGDLSIRLVLELK